MGKLKRGLKMEDAKFIVTTSIEVGWDEETNDLVKQNYHINRYLGLPMWYIKFVNKYFKL
jgi:hypothetical protein